MQNTFKKSVKPRVIEEFLDYYLYRRLAVLLIPSLMRVGLTPNQVTTLSLAFGLVSVFCLSRFWFIGAAFFAVVAIVFDCCDGQMARLTGKTHPLGRVLDGFFDTIWIALTWVTLYFCGYFQSWNLDVLWVMSLAGASTIFHCWRYDAAKIKYLEYISVDFHEGDLDVASAADLMKSEWKKGNYFWAFLSFIIMFQMFFFVRGTEKKQSYHFSEAQRSLLRQRAEPVMNRWSYLGEGHHNSLLIFGMVFAPWTPYVLLTAFWFILVPMNVLWLVCEFEFLNVKRALATG